MTDYSKSKIYKIVNIDESLVYYGSTVQRLSYRIAQHRRDYKEHLKQNRSYSTSFNIISGGKYKILLVENYSCANKEELLQREGWYITNNDCVNKIVPGRTKEQYRIDKKETLYKKNECPCGGRYTHNARSNHFKTAKHLKYLEHKTNN